jgi:ATP-dependent protease HslVU (ClpYQ) peptidase subunit
MSVAVAVKSQDRIVIASDTKRTFGSGAVPEGNLTDVKIRKVGSAYLAMTGWGIYSNIFDDYLAAGRRTPALTDQRKIFAFFRTFWRELHERYSFVNDQRHDEDSPFGDLDASFLIINPSGIYSVACDMSVTPFEQYYAIGSGASYALGAMHALYRGKVDAERVAQRAVEAAMELDIYCGGEVVSFSTRARKTRKR